MYAFCNQTVTVYRKIDNNVSRTVYDRAFLDIKKVQNVDKTGSREASGFLLVIPGDTQSVFVGDKILLGAGPEDIDWVNFIPAKVEGLVVASYADPKYFDGVIVHTEAGG